MLKEALISSKTNVRIASGPLYFVPWCLSHSTTLRGKTGLKHLSSWKQNFFKCLFLLTSWVTKNSFYQLHIICQSTFWTLISCCLIYVMCNFTRKSRPNIFHHWKDCLFFKTFHFQQPIKTWKSPYKFQSKCQNSLWVLINWSLMFVTFDDATRKNGFKIFVSVKTIFLKRLFLLTS